jgi:hypothetical protein
MKWIRLIIIFLLCTSFLQECDKSREGVTSFVSDETKGSDPQKAKAARDAAREGNIGKLANSFQDPPCADCASPASGFRSRRRHRVIGKHMVAEFGDPNCLVRGKSSIVNEVGVKFKGTSTEKGYLADIVATLVSMGGKDLTKKLLRGVDVTFKDSVYGDSGCIAGSQLSGKVEVGRSCPGIKFSEQAKIINLAHEVGHDMAGNLRIRAKYYKKLKSRCKVSTYCTHNRAKAPTSRSEEFSEAFAAYLTAPNKLKRAPGCRKAYDFFNEMLNKGKKRTCR